MIEIAMYIALGALAAGVLALTIIPAIWNRAVHLTRRRIEATVPLDVEEIRAEKDRMRAEFALTIRRMEKKLEAQRDASLQNRIEIDQQSEDLVSVAAERDSKADAVLELEERERVLRAELRGREEDLVRTSARLREAERKLIVRENEISILKGGAPRRESSFSFLSNGVDDTHDGSIDELDSKTLRREYKATRREFDAANIRIATLENELDSTRAALEESRNTVDELRIQIASDSDIASINAYAASDTADVRQLEAKVVELEARRVESEAKITQLTIALQNAGTTTPGSQDTANVVPMSDPGTKIEIAALQMRIAELKEERDRATAENDRLRTRGKVDDTDRSDAELHDKIKNLAADIASLTTVPSPVADTPVDKLVDAEITDGGEVKAPDRRDQPKSKTNGRNRP